MCVELDLESVPTLEASKMMLLNLLEDGNTEVSDIEQVVASDPAMAAKIMKLANSPFYRHTEQGLCLQDALRTVGFNMVKCITLSMAVMERLSDFSQAANDLWRHSYGVALVAYELGSTRNERQWLFTGGLLHDLGRMVLLSQGQPRYSALYEKDGSWPDTEKERELFAMDHTFIGEIVAKKWHFPPEVAGMIRNHHTPINRPSALIHVANLVVHQQQSGIPFDIAKYVGWLRVFLGGNYKDLVNDMIHRYKKQATIIKSLM